MVGRAPKRRRTQANDQQIVYPQEPQPLLDANLLLDHAGPDSGPSPQSLAAALSTPAVNTTTSTTAVDSDGPGFTMEGFGAMAAEMETNNYLQNLLSDYPDFPFVSSGPSDPFFRIAEPVKLPYADIIGTSGSENTFTYTPGRHQQLLASYNTSDASGQHTPGSLTQERTAESANMRSRFPEQPAARVSSSYYRDQSVISNYPHTAALMKMVEFLEEKLQIQSQVPIDQAMLLNRKALTKIRDVRKTNEFQHCRSCPLLVATVMDLVVGLYELVIPTIQQRPASEAMPDHNSMLSEQSARTLDETRRGGSVSSAAASHGNSEALFYFGCLEFDPDEQEMFRAAMIRRDLRRCVETIQFCNQEMMKQRKASLRVPPDNNASLSTDEHVHTGWYQEMAYRVKDLLAGVPALCDHGS